MKRGVDEKNMGLMFPRLHVNDTEKGGPRAPPRNKMALYEQLSVPSQIFSGNSNVNSGYRPLQSSSSQGSESDRDSVFPHQQIPTMHVADKMNNRYFKLNNELVHQEEKTNQEDEDYRVPILVQQSGKKCECSGNHQDLSKSTNGSSSFGHRNTSNNSFRLQNNGNSGDHGVDLISKKIIGTIGNPLLPVRDAQQEMVRDLNDPINGDDVSETSMVDSISGGDISPDDVVGIIGQEHFWKARRAIVNQQRAFATQVFELHRLLKVQRLIAGSPQSIAENDAFLGKPAEVAPIKRIPLDYVLKPSTNLPNKIKDHCDIPKDDTWEFSAENAVEQTPISSVQTKTQSTLIRYPLPHSDAKMGSWSLNQQHGHQWLIPVMSPSEGLIYKPYPGHGFMTAGPGPPPGSIPMIGQHYVNHGFPPPLPPHYQWPTGFHPLVHPPHGYFPHYGMATMNPPISESMNSNPVSVQYQGSSKVTPLTTFHASNNEVQGSTSNSQGERTQNREPLPLLPTCPPYEMGVESSRVIRAVPHNARSATDSVAQIFRSIQKERKQ